jgi:hypothetical protein
VVGLVVGEVRWRQTSPICDIRDVARDNTPLRGVCPSGIFRRRSLVMLFLSSGVHVAFSCRNPNLDRPRPSTEDDSEDDVQGQKDNRRRVGRLREPECGMPGSSTADVARCIILLNQAVNSFRVHVHRASYPTLYTNDVQTIIVNCHCSFPSLYSYHIHPDTSPADEVCPI